MLGCQCRVVWLVAPVFLPAQNRGGNQTDLVTVSVVLVIHVEQRVFLSTTDHQTGDEMGHWHRCAGAIGGTNEGNSLNDSK